MSALAVVVVAIGSSEAGQPPQSLTQEDALQLVRAFLHHSTKNVNGVEMAAAFFGSPDENSLAESGLLNHPFADVVRDEVMRDSFDTHPEYLVRRFMADGATHAVQDDSTDLAQDNLWAAFLEDDRYVARILRRLANATQAAFSAPSPPTLTIRIDDATRVALRVNDSLRKRESLHGCDAAASTAAFALWDEDPMLVASLVRAYSRLDPDDRSVAAGLNALVADGWKLAK